MWPCSVFSNRLRARAARAAIAAAAITGALAGATRAADGLNAGRADSLVGEARSAARNDAHALAIDLYRRAVENNPGLRDETALPLARELTWAGRYDEAEAELAALLDRRPKDRDARLHRALNCSWAGRTGEAMDIYAGLMHDDPDDVDAGLGFARMLSWAGRLEEAADAYRRIEIAHPDVRSAALGRAQVLNWSGRSREALRVYEEILSSFPDDESAIEGTALAEKWIGRPDRALARLETRHAPGGPAAGTRRLEESIRSDLAPRSGTFADYFEDSQDFRLWSVRQDVAVHPTPLLLLSPWISFRSEERPGEFAIHEIWTGIGAAWRLTTALSLAGGAAVIPAPETAEGAPRVSGDAYLNLEPDDFLKLTLAGSRNLFTVLNRFEAGPRVDRLTGDSFGFAASRKIDPKSSIAANYDYSIYHLGGNDDAHFRHNGRVRVRTEVRSRTPKLWLEAGYQHIDFNAYAPIGIWTPDRFQSFQLAADCEWRIATNFTLSGGLQGGRQREQQRDAAGNLAGSWNTFGGFTSRLSGRIAGFDVYAGGGRANASFETGRGYRRTYLYLGITRSY